MMRKMDLQKSPGVGRGDNGGGCQGERGGSSEKPGGK